MSVVAVVAKPPSEGVDSSLMFKSVLKSKEEKGEDAESSDVLHQRFFVQGRDGFLNPVMK